MHKLLNCKDVSDEVKLLIQTAVKISEILYACEEKRTPKAVLQLYNCTWVHLELCHQLISHPRRCSRKALFGTYTFML